MYVILLPIYCNRIVAEFILKIQSIELKCLPNPKASPGRVPKIPVQQAARIISVAQNFWRWCVSNQTSANSERPIDPAQESSPWWITITRSAKMPPEGYGRPVQLKLSRQTWEETHRGRTQINRLTGSFSAQSPSNNMIISSPQPHQEWGGSLSPRWRQCRSLGSGTHQERDCCL